MKKLIFLFCLVSCAVNAQEIVIRRGGGAGGIATNAIATNDINANQFLYNGILNLKTGATVTNLLVYGSQVLGRTTNSVGSVSAPSITFSNDTDSGIYQFTSGSVNVAANGVNVLTLSPGLNYSFSRFQFDVDGAVKMLVGTNSILIHPNLSYNYQTLSYNGGTNVTVDLKASSLFKLNITNNTYFNQPTNFPNTGYGNAFTIECIMDATGGYSVNFDTNYWKFSSNSIPVLSTNANAVSLLSCLTGSGGTNVYVSPSLRHR